MVRTGQRRAHRRALDRHGRDVTHTTYSQSGTDSYGDPTSEGAASSTVTARVDRETSATPLRNASGDEVNADVEIYVKDTVTITDVDSGDGRPDEFTVDDTSYVVLQADNQDSGIIRCFCQRK